MKLMVVDDNRQIREGIRLGIEWEKYGISEVRDFADGLEAFEAIAEYRPDIIIADIRMPNMDGLALLHEVRKCLSSCKYILLSAYSDFSYAQQAIRLGADDYILKPVKPSRLVEVVMKNARVLLDEKKEQEAYYEVYERSLIHSLANGQNIKDTEKMKQLMEEKYGIPLVENFLLIAVIRIEQADGKLQKKPVSDADLNMIEEGLAKAGAVLWSPDGEIVLIGKGCRSQLMSLERRYQMKKTIENINDQLLEQNLALTAGISDSMEISELALAYAHAREAVEQTYYGSSGTCMLYSGEGKKRGKSFPEERQKEFQERLAVCIRQKDAKGIRTRIEEIRSLGMREQYSKCEMTGFLKRLYLCLIRHAELDSDPDLEKRAIEEAMHFGMAMREMEEYLLHAVSGKDSGGGEENYSILVKNICTYLDEHYNEPVSVESAGELFARTPNYVSAKFKKEVGKSFTDYLIELRIKKAVGMLKYTNMPINEIAQKVGFSSYAYFSRTFRKYTGKNAGIYRNGKE